MPKKSHRGVERWVFSCPSPLTQFLDWSFSPAQHHWTSSAEEFAWQNNSITNLLQILLLIEEIVHQLTGRWSHYLQFFIHPRWFARIFPSAVVDYSQPPGFWKKWRFLEEDPYEPSHLPLLCHCYSKGEHTKLHLQRFLETDCKNVTRFPAKKKEQQHKTHCFVAAAAACVCVCVFS